MRTCSVDGCSRLHEAHGYCRMHYKRWRKHGDTAPRKPGKPYMGRTEQQIRVLIAANVVIADSGCWEWQRGLAQAGGYAVLSWRGLWNGHRVSYAVHVGPIPPGMFVCHRCDNPPCVNPEHLFLGSPDDNNADMTTKGRARRAFAPPPRGERHHLAKLTDAEVAEIRASADRGVDLAAQYGVSQQLVSDIRGGRRRQAASSNAASS